MKQFYNFFFLRIKQILKNGMLIAALLAVSMGYSQNEDTIQLGDGGGNVNYFPMYYLYNYSYTQTVYSAEELYEQGAVEQATTITKIKYKPTSSQSTSNWKDWVVYIGNTSKESFDDTTDWVPISDMSEVFDGQLQDDVTADEWVEITLDTSFEWDGTSNIVIAVDQNTASYGGNPNWAGYVLEPTSGTKGICFYSDGTNPEPDNPPTTGSYLKAENQVAQIQLVGEFLESCSGTPVAGTVDEDNLNVCAGDEFTVSVLGATNPALGLERIWQSSPSGEDDWTDIEGVIAPSYTVNEGVMEATDFRYMVTCTNSDETAISDVVTVNLNPGTECYCVPEGGGNNSDDIVNFSLADLDHDSASGSSTTEPGYSDFAESVDPAELVPGESYEASLTSGSGSGNHGAAIWIDYNDDGLFSSSEKVATISSSIYGGSTATFPEFTVLENPGMHRLRVQYDYNTDGTDMDPCDVTQFSETEDYTVEIIQLEVCEGTPTAGIPDDEDFSICAVNAFSISVSGASEPANGLERNWQSSPEGENNWIDIEGATASTYLVADGIEGPTDFRYKVTCTNSNETAISEVIMISLKPGTECYCTPSYNNSCSSGDRISNVSLTGESESFNNDTECSDDNYGDYTDLTPPDLVSGETYALSVSTDFSTPQYEQVRAWIDYDQNGYFSDDEEIANTNGDGLVDGTQTFNFTVLEGLESNNYRMRVRLVSSSSSDFDACESKLYGETEDYIVEIIGQLGECEGTPTAGTVEDDFSVCAGNSFSLNVSGASDPANGLVRIWQSSPSGEDDWTDIEGAVSNTYSAPNGIMEPTDFRYKVTCTNSDETVFSDVIALSLKVANECYCLPEGASDNGHEIVDFSLGDLDNDSESGSSTSGYSDFTDSVDPVDLISGENYAAALTSGSGTGDHGAAIWIDYNDDGIFDSSEKVSTLGIIISSNETITFPEFTIANSPGLHRLRVQYTAGQHGGDLDPCQVSTSSSETEDYMVNVVGENCEAPSDVSVEVENTAVVVDWTENGSATEWNLIYGAPSFNPETEGTSITVQNKPATINDLDPQTDYEIYVVAICDDDNVSGPSNSEAFTTGELSVNSQVFENFTFYPNPVKSQLTLKAGTQIENVNVYNLLGQNVLSSKPNTLQTQLDTERLQAGIYLMKVTINGNTNVFRVVKQ